MWLAGWLAGWWWSVHVMYVRVQVLHDLGEDETAMSMLARTEEPSFNYMLQQGPGTIWESWTGSGSRSHPMFCGGVGLYLYTLAGIEVAELVTGGNNLNGGHEGVPPVTFSVPPLSVRQQLGSARVTARKTTISWAIDGINAGTVTVNASVPFAAQRNTGSLKLSVSHGATVELVSPSSSASVARFTAGSEESAGVSFAGLVELRNGVDGRSAVVLGGGEYAFKISSLTN